MTSRLILLVLCVVALTACAQAAPPDESEGAPINRIGVVSGGTSVDRVIDDRYGVVCYVSDGYKSGGISCIKVQP